MLRLYPNVFNMVSNADSLVLIDFARDLVSGHPTSNWNLPRVPYLFPDTLIALAIIFFGWAGTTTITLIATINFCCLCLVSLFIFRKEKYLKTISLFLTQLLMASSILFLGIGFPEALSNLYWQIFASGAHFLTAVVVALIFLLAQRPKDKPLSSRRLAIILALTFAVAVSNSMSILLMGSWWVMQMIYRRKYLLQNYLDLIATPLAIIIGTATSFLLPRQELVGSFLSINQFENSVRFFVNWMLSSPFNYGFLILLFTLVLAWPFLHKKTLPYQLSDFKILLEDDYFLPSMAIFFATPLFYQEVGSMRYFAFPAFVSLLSLSLIFFQLSKVLSRGNSGACKAILVLMLFFLIALAGFKNISATSQYPQAETSFDKVGLSTSASNANNAYQCIMDAAKLYPLKDGIASYWSARPIRFASDFKYYLGQINPWRPRSGYFLWGNNGADFVYKKQSENLLRQYNFIIATNHEVEIGLWRPISLQASRTFQCQSNTIYYFNEDATLWTYLFPLGDTLNLGPSNMPSMGQAARAPFVEASYPANEVFTLAGKVDGETIKANGQSGFLTFGPYIPLDPGKYQLTVFGSLAGPNTEVGFVDVISGGGKHTYAKYPIGSTLSANHKIITIEFAIEKPVKDLEFRLFILKDVFGEFTKYHLRKISQ